MNHDMDLMPAQPMSPAGMVRISNGSRQRCIWPVHLPGWLALGWQLKQPMAGSARAQTTALASSPAPQPEVDTPAVDAAAAKRRGRKAKSVDAAAVAEPAQAPLAAEDEPPVEPVVDPQELTAGEDLVAAGSDPAADGATAPDAGGGFALPDDLLNAEF